VRLLLDTHVLLWWLSRSQRLGPIAEESIASPASEVCVSGLTVAEIEIERALGKLEAPDDLQEQLAHHGFDGLSLTVRHALGLRDLPLHHGDPIDRLLIAQARAEGLTFVTADRAMSAYDVPILLASV
jgi:PIN domain nuclease of toxin-antitoxin system